jgi:hypothetical protein
MNKAKRNILSINLNEVTLDWIKAYSLKFNLPNIDKLLKLNFITTTSEKKYQNLEPWIQWPSYYQGKSKIEHNCFHLGDIKLSSSFSIYDWFQENGKNVLALAPMNCTFSPNADSLLVHDPWSSKGVINGSKSLNSLWRAVCYFVNENSGVSFKLNN